MAFSAAMAAMSDVFWFSDTHLRSAIPVISLNLLTIVSPSLSMAVWSFSKNTCETKSLFFTILLGT